MKKNRWIENRYRKWCRKAHKKSDPNALMKWKYWFKLYHRHTNLWIPINPFNPPA